MELLDNFKGGEVSSLFTFWKVKKWLIIFTEEYDIIVVVPGTYQGWSII